MGHKIKEIKERLNEIAADKTKFDLSERYEDRGTVHREREMTHSYVHAADVVGRDGDKEKIIEQYLMHHVDSENVSIIPIVGIGGLGKTTLAKLVYNDERVVNHFHLRMWVCVSEEFSLQKLIPKIIESAIGQNCSNLNIDQLQRKLRENVDRKRYLLILDDVWNEDPRKWSDLKTLLTGGANGSKIVVTTRSEKVASIMGTMPAYKLKELSNEQCLSLFLKCAFPEGEENQYPRLREIGKDIVRKCKGVPLAIITLGTLLSSAFEERYWKSIRDSDIWKLEQKEDDILPALRLSYEHLPRHLKRCFAYCSVFPKDFGFLDTTLVQFWMAHGLIQKSNEKEQLEDVGLRYLKQLQSRCVFQDFQEIRTLAIFKMHDLLHDLASSVAQNECSIVTSNSQQISESVRHLSFWEPESIDQGHPTIKHQFERLRTVILGYVGEEFNSNPVIKACFSRLKYLRTLFLAVDACELLPEGIGTLKHLRFLCLSRGSKIQKLPNSICNLQNLQTLILDNCNEIEELPRDIRYLISLRCLWISTKQKRLPNGGIGCLESLRDLCLDDCKNLEYLCEDIGGLKNLRKLVIIRCKNLISLPQSTKYLSKLENFFIGGCNKLDLTMEGGEDNQDSSQFSLQNLMLGGLPKLVYLPQWILRGSVNTLQFLMIEDCPNIRELPGCLQNISSLQELRIINCPALEERCKREIGSYPSH